VVVDCSGCDADVTSDENRASSSTFVRHIHQGAPRSQSTTTTTSCGSVQRQLVVTDDDVRAAEARLDDAETYVHLDLDDLFCYVP